MRHVSELVVPVIIDGDEEVPGQQRRHAEHVEHHPHPPVSVRGRAAAAGPGPRRRGLVRAGAGEERSLLRDPGVRHPVMVTPGNLHLEPADIVRHLDHFLTGFVTFNLFTRSLVSIHPIIFMLNCF